MQQLAVKLADVTIAVRRHGPHSGRVAQALPGAGPGTDFLLVHGLASNARLWDETAAALAEAGHRAWAVDLRGHGDSELPDGDIGTATAAADLAAVCAALGLTTVVVAGQSWGGNVAVQFAAEQRDLVTGLALVDGGWIDLAAQFSSWAECERALRPPVVDGMRAAGLLDWLREAHPDWSETAIEATAYNLRVLPDGSVERRLPIPRHMEIVRDMWESPPWPWLAQISVPTLLLPAVPEGDRAVSVRRGVARAADALTDARVREYVGGDHDLHAQRPKELAADLLSLVG